MQKLILFILLLCCIKGYAQNNSTQFSKIKINIENKDIKDLAKLGIEVDHGIIVLGKYIINDYSEHELEQIKAANFKYEVLIEDVKTWYKNQHRDAENYSLRSSNGENCNIGSSQNEPIFETPENYSYGSMGGYLTYNEMLEVLDSMQAKFPNLISQRQAIGSPAIETWRGNNVFWLKISDNPNIEEAEPQVLFTSLHHAREPNSLSQNIFFMWYLLENYATNEEIKYLVDNTETYFIPCINPDGYILNELNDPNGGGLIRKNGRDNNNDNVYNENQDGVDLNRNYGYQWGYDNTGSSPNPTSQTYRGPSGFSEPETQAVKQFCEAHQFQITLNYHTFGNLLIHPWGYTDTLTAEHATFSVFGEEMTQYNKFTFGTGTETVGYTVNGDSDDWMYGETVTKGRIFSMTPEAGDQSANFWPMQSQIDAFNKANMHQNISALRLVLNYVELEELNAVTNLFSPSGNLVFLAQKKGLKTGANTISFTSLSSELSLGITSQIINLNHLDTQSINLVYDIDTASIDNDTELRILVTVDNELHSYYDTIVKQYSKETATEVFIDNSNNFSKWQGNGWSLTTNDFYSSPSSTTESPNGEYSANESKSVRLAQAVDLNAYTSAEISFWAKWDIENDYDYTQIQISTDGGLSYIPLCGLYTNDGTSDQDFNQPLYDNVQNDWVKECIDISDYVGNDIIVRFFFKSDMFEQGDGFYFDDFKITAKKEDSNTSIVAIDGVSFSIYPNPVNDMLHISLDKATGFELQIQNALGKKVFSSEFDTIEKTKAINTSEWSKGFYFGQITIEGETRLFKFIKQ